MKLADKTANEIWDRFNHPTEEKSLTKISKTIESNYAPLARLIDEIFNLAFAASIPFDKRVGQISRNQIIKGILERSVKAQNIIKKHDFK